MDKLKDVAGQPLNKYLLAFLKGGSYAVHVICNIYVTYVKENWISTNLNFNLKLYNDTQPDSRYVTSSDFCLCSSTNKRSDKFCNIKRTCLLVSMETGSIISAVVAVARLTYLAQSDA